MFTWSWEAMACLVEEALMRLKRELAIPVPTGAWMSAIHGGDYFFMEALTHLTADWKGYWY